MLDILAIFLKTLLLKTEIKQDKMEISAAITYDDILIVPQYSEVTSRSLVDTTSRLTKSIDLPFPVISANMDTVTEAAMASAMSDYGAVGIIHRFLPIEDQLSMVSEVAGQSKKMVGAAVGVKGDYLDRAHACAEAGASFLCIDIAHGHSKLAGDALLSIKDSLDIDVIVGNVATYAGAKFLAEHGADAVKVGVGPGMTCVTRKVAGVGVPQLSALIDAVMAADEYDIPVIADGGIRFPADVAKAIGAGASTVMVGGLLAPCIESPGKVVHSIDGHLYKQYRGMASSGAMDKIKKVNSLYPNTALESLEKPVTPEGVDALVPYSERPASSVLDELIGGLRSAMSYSNALTIEEFHSKVQFITVTNAGIIESGAHDVIQK